jgi:hypothetical protein
MTYVGNIDANLRGYFKLSFKHYWLGVFYFLYWHNK